MRKKIDMMDATGMLVTMSEGNPGAITVLMKLLGQGTEGLMDVLHLDDMNIRGTQILVAWKDWAKQDLETFIKAVRERNQDMVAAVNAARLNGNHTEVAVTSGASFAK